MDQRGLYFLQQMNIDVWRQRCVVDMDNAVQLLVITDDDVDKYKALLQGICLALSIEWPQMQVVTSSQCPAEHQGWLLWAVAAPCSMTGAKLLSTASLYDIHQQGQFKRQIWEKISTYAN